MQFVCPLNQPDAPLNLIVKFLAIITLIPFVIVMLIGPKVIRTLKRLKITQPGKDELEKVIKTARLTRGRPIMGGLLILIGLGAYILIARILGTFSPQDIIFIFAIVAGGAAGLLNDFFDLRGKVQRMRIHDRYNSLIHGSFTRYFLWHYISWPLRVFRKITTPFGSYSTGLRTSHRFGIQFALGVAGTYLIHRFFVPVTFVWLPFVGGINLPLLVSLALYGIIAVAFINGFNITDGVDAISASNHAISFLGALIMAVVFKEYGLAKYIAALIGAELGFLFYNIPNAKIEMSDVGTVPIGLLYTLVFVYLNRVFVSPLMGVWYVIIAGSSFLQVFWVLVFKRRLFKIAPFHHLLEHYGIERPAIVMYSNLVTTIGVILGLIIGV